MYRILNVSAFVLLCHLVTFAQNSNISVAYNGLNTEYTCLYNNKDTVHIAGFSLFDKRSNFTYLHSLYHPSKKTVTHKLSYISDNDYAWRNLNLIKSKERYISCIRSAFSDDSFNKAILVADRTGQIIKNVESGLNTKGGVYYQYIFENPDSTFIVYAQIDFRIPNRPFYRQVIYKLDKDFKTLDSIFVDSFNFNQIFSLYVGGLAPHIPGQYRQVINAIAFSCTYTQSKFDIQLVDFDQNLKIKRQKGITDRRLILTNSLFVDNNSSIIYGQIVDSTICPRNFQTAIGRPYIAMLDSNFNFKWEIKFEKGTSPAMVFLLNYSLDRVIRLKDGNFLAIGDYDYPDLSTPGSLYERSGLLIKFDNKGTIIWSKRHRYDEGVFCPESSFNLRDVAELSNGEIVAVGALSICSQDTSSGQRGWILHLSPNGEVIKSQILSNSLYDFISIHPNPFEEKININNLENGSYFFELYNTIGQKLTEGNFNSLDGHNSLSFSNIPKGNYILQILSHTHELVSSHKLEKH